MSGKCFTRLTLLAADDKPNELFCYLLLNTLEMVLEKQLECPTYKVCDSAAKSVVILIVINYRIWVFISVLINAISNHSACRTPDNIAPNCRIYFRYIFTSYCGNTWPIKPNWIQHGKHTFVR